MTDATNETFLTERKTQNLIELLKNPNFSNIIENKNVLEYISKMCNNCPICLEKLDNNLTISKCENPANSTSSYKPCGVLFHSNCLNKHFLYDNRCPNCRFIHIKAKKPLNDKPRVRTSIRPRGQQNPYIAFCCDNRYKIIDEKPRLNPIEGYNKLTELWRTLSIIEKQFYVIKAREHNRMLNQV